jgi:hypothetical protein
MRVLLGHEGGSERVILCVAALPALAFYLAVRVGGRYYRLAMGWPFGLYAGRSERGS